MFFFEIACSFLWSRSQKSLRASAIGLFHTLARIPSICSMILCYVTVGTFAQLELGLLSKYTEWSVLGSVLSTKSEVDLDSFW